MGKIVITGTGRCGTSFLMHLLTNMDVNTGYTPEEATYEMQRIDELNAGLEHGIHCARIDNSQVIKNPDFMRVEVLTRLLELHEVDRFIIPMRDSLAVSNSRAFMSKSTPDAYGGLWFAKTVEEQVNFNYNLVYNFLHFMALNDIPITFINFNSMMSSPTYLYDKLKPIFKFKNRKKFFDTYLELINPEYVRF